ncbi:hypothetical protein R7Q39_22260 [Vibrio sp. 947]|uniref:hypothetical protein n=1 Tax=unclassified Vibrio TaxID=2614977 RepID=UPI0029652837|nr:MULTISPECIES: hypothetical protein [unclassified Vibrio]MDW1583537.1 hypothetical protein [Vibrio sp. Vb2897]MDW1641859.1 hypothetical protein [Vibrio sp. Vb2896]MDW1928130.1 hypothetical protein [Vibrio sp. 947]
MKYIVMLTIFGLLFYFKEEIVLAIRMLLGLEKDNDVIEDKPIEDYTLGEVCALTWRKVKHFFSHRSTVSINDTVLKVKSAALIILPVSMILCYMLVDQGDVLFSYTMIHILILYFCTEIKKGDDNKIQ